MSTIGRISKKVHRREDEPPDDDGDEVMVEEGRAKPFSFRDAVLNSGSDSPARDDNWESEDVDLKEKDVWKIMEDGVPAIDFSERIYGLIDESMSQTLVVKLLGCKIGYTTLWNKVCALWKLFRRFQLMDIENDYYWTNFEAESDFHHVLSKGTWVIYGHYLIVQP